MKAIRPNSVAADRGRRAAIAGTLTGITILVIALGTLHILVWNPLAKVPGLSLDQIYERMRAAGEGELAGTFVTQWAMFWGIVAVGYLLVCLVPRTSGFLTTRQMTALGLLIVGLTSLGSWFAGFNMGMSVADTFFTSGGNAAVSGPMILILGAVSLLAAAWALRRPMPPEPATGDAIADA